MTEDLRQTVMEAPGGLWLYKIVDWSGDSIVFEQFRIRIGSGNSQQALQFRTNEIWGVDLTLEQSEAFAKAILAKVEDIRKHV